MRRSTRIIAAMALMGSSLLHAESGSVEMRLRALESRLPDADRLAVLESALATQGAGVLAAELEQLKAEVRELRGQIEQLAYQIKQQQQGRQQLYGDLDRRLQALESRPSPAAVPNPVNDPEVVLEAVPSDATADSAAEGQEQADYLAAFEMLQQGRTNDAVGAFQRFLVTYPKGNYASNALYWLGEAHYVSKHYPQSLVVFQKLVEQHPDSPKLPGALLKIGYIHYETRNYVEARTVLEKVKGGYPGSNTAKLAAERLERMRKEGV